MKTKAVAVACMCIALGIAAHLIHSNGDPEASSERDEYDWDGITAMIAAGISANERYAIEEVQLEHVPLSSSKIFLVIVRQYEQLLGPRRRPVLYHPDQERLEHDRARLRTVLETARYDIDSPDELLAVATEVAPLLYGCSPMQHEILTSTDVVGAGRLPITKDVIHNQGRPPIPVVNYYGRMGPWNDIVHVSAVLHGERLDISLHPVHQPLRAYE